MRLIIIQVLLEGSNPAVAFQWIPPHIDLLSHLSKSRPLEVGFDLYPRKRQE